jgi:hypothetical protein
VNRAPNTLWCLRGFDGPYVKTADDDRIEILVPDGNGYVNGLSFNRKDARLLAKRINQCLDATRKK